MFSYELPLRLLEKRLNVEVFFASPRFDFLTVICVACEDTWKNTVGGGLPVADFLCVTVVKLHEITWEMAKK